MSIFVDSNYLIALSNPNDSLHDIAIRLSDKLLKENTNLFISNYVFLEIVTVLTQRVNKEIALITGTELLQNRQVEIIHITKNLQQKSWEIFKMINKKNISFVDCSCIAVMEFENISTLLSFDKTDFIPLQKLLRFDFYYD